MGMNNISRFAEIMREETRHTRTENGAFALNTSRDALVDLYSVIGALRRENGKIYNNDIQRLHTLIDEAINEDKLLTAKILFYSRDIKEGLGEREIFRESINYCAKNYPELIENNIGLIPYFGRFDDLYALIDTPLEEKMWKYMKSEFESDLEALRENKPVTLLAKWIKSADANSSNTRKLGIATAINLGYDVPTFKRLVKSLRKHINIVETKVSNKEYDAINYEFIPSRAMMRYRNTFMKNDKDRFESFLNDVNKGNKEIKANGIYPYDIVEKILYSHESNNVLESQWRALPNFVEDNTNALVMVDTSGSMSGRPLASALGLGLYFAEHNTGAFHNLFMTFSNRPEFVEIKGNTLTNKINNMSRANWSMNTDLHSAFKKVLNLAIENNIRPEEMIKSIIVISDMEIDCCTNKNWTFYDTIREEYREHGYEIPNIVFWNVDSRNNIFHADVNRKGVQFVSGQAVSSFKNVIDSIGLNPYEAMMNKLNDKRYDCITLEDDYIRERYITDELDSDEYELL